MSPVIRVPDTTFIRLESKAKGFDTPVNVIDRLLDFLEGKIGKEAFSKGSAEILREQPSKGEVDERSHKAYSLASLQQKDLTKIKPSSIIIDGESIQVSTWSDACFKLVDWLVQKGKLTEKDLPVFAAAGEVKYFINNKKVHSIDNLDGSWKKVRDNVYVDVKYNSKYHVLNISAALKTLGVSERLIKIEL